MSKYVVFNNNEGQSLVYYPCAKNANSSAKLFFMKHLGKDNEIFFIEDEIPRYKGTIYHQRVKKMKNKINLITLFPPYEKFSKVNADFKCCNIRNPIERSISHFKMISRTSKLNGQDLINEEYDKIINRSLYYNHIMKLLKVYNKEQILLSYYDTIKSDPQLLLQNIHLMMIVTNIKT